MTDSEPTLVEQIQQATARIKGLADLHGQIVEAGRQLQEVLLFDGHPEMVRLDGELDNLYPEARDDR